MPPKAQPRRKQPPRNGQDTAREDEPSETLSAPSTKEPLIGDLTMSQGTAMEVDPVQASESQPSTAQTEERTPTTAAGSPPPPRPVRRLASVLPRTSSSIASRPDGESRPSSLKFKPKSFIRRSKEEREAVEKAEAERHTAKLAAERRTAAGGRGGQYSRGRSRVGGLGDEFSTSRGATGFLGGSTLPDPSSGRRSRGGISGGGRTGSRRQTQAGPADSSNSALESTGTGVKKEHAVKPEKDRDGDTVMTSSESKSKQKRTKVKKEGQAPTYVSSDGEFGSDGEQRVDIEKINLITDDEDSGSDIEPASEVAKGKKRQRSLQPRYDALRPVRIQRHEHVERAVGVNTDASSLTSAELRHKAKERNEAGGSLFLPESEEMGTVQAPKVKGRKKLKDVEFVRDERLWKGVYQDENYKRSGIKVKDEPKDEDDRVIIDAPAQEKVPKDSAMEVEEEEPVPLREAIQESLPDINETSKTTGEIEKPSLSIQGEENDDIDEEVLDTYEEWGRVPLYKKLALATPNRRRRWLRNHMTNQIDAIASLLDDLAPTSSSSPTTSTETPDPNSSVTPSHTADPFSTTSNPSYIFQLPPLLPTLRDITKPAPSIKEEKKTKPEPTTTTTAKKPPTSTNPFATVPIKSDPDILPDTSSSLLPHTYVSGLPFTPPSGCPGTLCIHKDGTLSTEWGAPGLCMSVVASGVGKGAMAQELVLTRVESGVEKVEDEDVTGRGGLCGGSGGDRSVGAGRGMKGWEEKVKVGEKGWGMGEVSEGWTCVPNLAGLVG